MADFRHLRPGELVAPDCLPRSGKPPARSGTGRGDRAERETLVEVARGLPNAEIARKLHISQATVKTHVSHLFDKLDVRDRVQLVIVGYETGLVTPGRRP